MAIHKAGFNLPSSGVLPALLEVLSRFRGFGFRSSGSMISSCKRGKEGSGVRPPQQRRPPSPPRRTRAGRAASWELRKTTLRPQTSEENHPATPNELENYLKFFNNTS